MNPKTPGFDSHDYDAPHRSSRQAAYKKTGNSKRYMTAAIVLGGGTLVGGSALSAYNSSQQSRNYGTPLTHNGRQYYIPGDSRRAVYPSKEACMQDVPWDRQAECEPTSGYNASGRGAGWYGPVYNPRDTYQPGSQYPTEVASSRNTGAKSLPKGANSSGFGANGKAFTGSTGS